MTDSCIKDKLGFHPEPMSDLVNRIQQMYLKRDRVTIVAYQVAGITVKIQNLVIFFFHFGDGTGF